MNFILFMYDFFKGLLYFFIVHLLEIPDVIMTLQINLGYPCTRKRKKNPDDCIVRFWSRVCSFNALSLYLESTLMTLILQGIFIVALSLRILLVCRYITLVYWVKVSISVLDLQLKMLCKFQSYHDPQEFLCNGQLKNDCFKS